MVQLSIGAALGWLAEQDPDRVAVRDAERSLTRRELDLASNRLARAYQGQGVQVDDLVAVGLPNGVAFYVACAAVWKAGATPLPLSPRIAPAERQAVLELARPALTVETEQASSLSDRPLPDLHASSWKAALSGGSTGRPKVIKATSPALVEPGRSTASYLPDRAVQLVSGPLDHSAPFLFSMRGLFAGHSLVVLPRFDAEAALNAVDRHRVSWALLVPTMMQRIWRLPEEVRTSYDVSSLESVLHLGAPCPAWLKRAWIDWLGPERVWEVYAGTESTGVTVISGAEWLEHPGSVGRAAPGFAFRVVGPDGRELPAGERGEVWMRSTKTAGPTYRYVGQEPGTVDGWDTLGDVGRLDADGYLHLDDRSADLVLVGGANVWPAEVEAVLDEHPAVRSSAVFGVPHHDLGEVPHAVVDVPGGGVSPAELLAWAGERLERYKVPRTLEVVDAPLRDDAGKVRRRQLREVHLAADA